MHRAVVKDFTTACLSDDLPAFGAACAAVSEREQWRAAFQSVSRIPEVHRAIQEEFVGRWCHEGDGFRNSVGDDGILIGGLKKLLPPYSGPDLTLFRGDSAFNRKRRSYGLAWSADQGTSAGFATGVWQTFDGGSVLLKTEAPSTAIICDISSVFDYGESEFLVDRRALRSVEVIARYPQRAA